MLGTIEKPTFRVKGIHLNASVMVWVMTLFLRILGLTLRKQFVDKADCARHQGPVFVVFWHNRILGMLLTHKRLLKHRRGFVGMTSYSGEGTVLSRVLGRFGMRTVRGSSSRRGAGGVLGLLREIRRGYDVGFAPDGPRGPSYRLSRGPMFLALKAQIPIVYFEVEYSRYVRLKTWDRFMIPLPFSKVVVTSHSLPRVGPECGDQVATLIADIERMMQPLTK
jgi:hypothetical protein